jgi:hypothetical protein
VTVDDREGVGLALEFTDECAPNDVLPHVADIADVKTVAVIRPLS